MADLVVRNGRIIGPDSVLEGADLLVRDGKFAAVGPGAGRDFPGADVVDAAGAAVWPGFIDIHIHGARGELVGSGMEGDLASIGLALATQGVTRFCPTLLPMPADRLAAEVSRTAAACDGPFEGAVPLGLHLEGPFLNTQRSGALPVDCLRDPDPGEFEELASRANGRLRMVTLAPELPGALGLVEAVRASGAVASAGHTEASLSEMEEAAKAGLTHVTHCFNAMRRMSHRSPGPVEAALTLPGLSSDVICDGRHVHKVLVDIMIRCMGAGALSLISDATAFQAQDGSLAFLGRRLEVRRGIVRDTQTGALGGSTISVRDAAVQVREWFDPPLPLLAGLASLNPARVLGLDRELGSLEPGKIADFFIADENLAVRETFIAGKRIWRTEGPNRQPN